MLKGEGEEEGRRGGGGRGGGGGGGGEEEEGEEEEEEGEGKGMPNITTHVMRTHKLTLVSLLLDNLRYTFGSSFQDNLSSFHSSSAPSPPAVSAW